MIAVAEVGAGDAIRRRIKVLELSWDDVAERAGIGTSTVYRATVGRNLQVELAQALSEALEWPPDAIHRLAAGDDPERWIYLAPGESPDDGALSDRVGWLEAQVRDLKRRLKALEG